MTLTPPLQIAKAGITFARFLCYNTGNEILRRLRKMKKRRYVIYFKFGKNRWIKRLIDGDLSFSCAGKFVYDAKKTGNTIQGDELEGVFARLKINDSRVSEMKNKLQNDLEILPDVDGYVMLRRKSALLKPIFCVYGYKDEDILSDCVDLKPGSNLATHFFNEDMYSGFSDSLSINKVLRAGLAPATSTAPP